MPPILPKVAMHLPLNDPHLMNALGEPGSERCINGRAETAFKKTFRPRFLRRFGPPREQSLAVCKGEHIVKTALHRAFWTCPDIRAIFAAAPSGAERVRFCLHFFLGSKIVTLSLLTPLRSVCRGTDV